MGQYKIYLLDDHKIVRDGLKSLLSIDTSFVVIGEESNPHTFFETLPNLEIDILILDISLPQISGLDVLKKLKSEYPTIKVIMLSMHDSPEYILKSIREGANAYLPKNIQAEEFISALREVSINGHYYPKNLNSNSILDLVPELSGGHQEIITPKEKEVLEYMAKGYSSKLIAAKFGLSSRTVEAHRLNIMKKLGTNNSAETIAIAARLKLI